MKRLPDRNDVDQYSMDQDTRRRLRVRHAKSLSIKKKKDVGPDRSPVVDETKGTAIDTVTHVKEIFLRSSPEFLRSVVSEQHNRNGWVIRGAWPSSGKKIFDWEFDIFGEGRGSVVIRFNVWDSEGNNDWQAYRATIATANKTARKFVQKTFLPMKANARMVANSAKECFSVNEYCCMVETLTQYFRGVLCEATKSKLTPFQKAQRNRRQTVALHTQKPSTQSTFYKHAVRAIFNKLRKDGESFRGSAKGGQLIAQWMMKKYGYAHGSHIPDQEDPENIGRVILTSKGKQRNRKHTSEPKSVLARKQKAYDHIMGIRRKRAAKEKSVADKSLGAG